MKNIYHIAEDITYESGGVRTVLENLDNYLNQNQFLSKIITNKKENQDNYVEFRPKNKNPWSYTSDFSKYLTMNKNNIDLLHLHGVFMHAQYTSYKFAIKNNIPFSVTPHGMLEPWHLKDKALKKKIYYNLFLKNIFKHANVIHTITPYESENIFKLTKNKNIIEIPNFIHYSSLPNDISYAPKEEYLLFLSRIHPKKGLDILIKSMTKIDDKEIKLKIVGTENAYAIELKNWCKSIGLQDRVEFIGGVYGAEKYDLYANAKAFIAPSYTEAIGMVNLEAAACKTPVITTFNTGINPEWNANGGIMINPVLEELITAINEVNSWTFKERTERGNLLFEFVFDNYSWEKKGYLWDEFYTNI